MNDSENLYLAAEIINDEPLNYASISFIFDSDNDGVAESGDDVLLLVLGPSWTAFMDMARQVLRSGLAPPATSILSDDRFWDLPLGGTDDGKGAIGQTSVDSKFVSVYEISHPLNSADDMWDFSLKSVESGRLIWKAVGFLLEIHVCDSSGCRDTLVPGPDSESYLGITTVDPVLTSTLFPACSPFFWTLEDEDSGASPITGLATLVTRTGETSLIIVADGDPPPNGFRTGDPSTYYEVTTTAEFSGKIEISIDYNGTSFGDESALQLFQLVDERWVNITTSLDTDGNTISGTTMSLSTFSIFEPLTLTIFEYLWKLGIVSVTLLMFAILVLRKLNRSGPPDRPKIQHLR